MAKGDTKTNQYLDIAANGTRADLPTDTCCETRSQTLIREVAERIIGVEEEVEDLKNNPDVVDIVDTYADLQNYDTSGLTDKDIIRVIADETKGGLSSYYRWNSPNPGWNFVGVIPGGGGIKELSSDDYNYPENNPDRVALWLLDNGLYTAPAGVMVAASTTSYPWYNTSDKTILVGGSDTVKGIYTFLNGKVDVVTTQVSDGVEAGEYTLLKSNQVVQTTGASTTDIMSQNATTGMVYGDIINLGKIRIGQGSESASSRSVAIGMSARAGYNSNSGTAIGSDTYAIGQLNTAVGESARAGSGSSQIGRTVLGAYAQASNNYASALGAYAQATGQYTVAIGSASGAANAPNAGGLGAIAIGRSTVAGFIGSVSIGAGSVTTRAGEVNIGTSDTTYGYNNTSYRVLGGVHDGIDNHDAVTVGQLSAAAPAFTNAEFNSIFNTDLEEES